MLYAPGDRILLKADQAEYVSAGGIMLTEGAVEKPCTAVIVAVGPGKKEKPDDEEVKPVGVAVGDRVMYFKYAGDKAGFVCVQVGIQFLFLRWLFRPPARPPSLARTALQTAPVEDVQSQSSSLFRPPA